MQTQHSEVFYYAIAVYALGAAAFLALPNGVQPQPIAKASDGDSVRTAVSTAATQTSVRNAVSAQSHGLVFAGTPVKF